MFVVVVGFGSVFVVVVVVLVPPGSRKKKEKENEEGRRKECVFGVDSVVDGMGSSQRHMHVPNAQRLKVANAQNVKHTKSPNLPASPMLNVKIIPPMHDAQLQLHKCSNAKNAPFSPVRSQVLLKCNKRSNAQSQMLNCNCRNAQMPKCCI